MQRGGTLCAAALAWMGTACATPPAGVQEMDASAMPSSVDAGVADAAPPEAETPDACVPFVADDDDGPGNPLGIRLIDITYDMPEQFPGGFTPDDNLAFGSGTVLADLDADGDLDVILARNGRSSANYPAGPTLLLENQGGFDHLVPHPGFSAFFLDTRAHAASAADYDNDGDLDVFVGLESHDVLLRNDGDLNFTDVSEESGLNGPATHTSGGIWADVNRDGLLDIYVTTHWYEIGVHGELNENRLYLNRGDGTFRDVTETAGVAGNGSTHAALIGDLDQDGDLEIYVANDRFAADGMGGSTVLDTDRVYDLVEIDPQGRPIYTDKSRVYGVADQRSSMGIALADIDHDGIDDLYVTDIGRNHVERWNPAGPSYVSDFGYYGLAARSMPDGDLFFSWGARFMDLDRDGWLEAFVVNGAVTSPVPCRAQLQRDLFFRSTGGVYAEITQSVGLPYGWTCPVPARDPMAGRGLVQGDLDGDGDDDFVIAPFVEAYRFVRNDTPYCERPTARVRLRGTVSGTDPVGAVLEIELEDGRSLRRQLYAGGDTYSQSDRVLEAALPSVATAAAVLWPSGIRQPIQPASLGVGTLLVEEPRWIEVVPHILESSSAPPATITTKLLDDDGVPLGPSGAGRQVRFERSDGVATATIDHGDGSYSARLPHPGKPGHITVSILVGNVTLLPRPGVWFR